MNTADSIDELARMEEEIEHQLVGVNYLIAALKQRARPQEWEGGGDNTPLGDGADAAQAVEQRGSDSWYVAGLIQRSAGLERALRRIQEGTYGRCERCKRLIGTERLHVLPETQHCLVCEKELERSAVDGAQAEKR